MTATAWIKNSGLFQSATFSVDCFSVPIHQCGQTNCCASTAGEVVYQISGAGMIGQGSEAGWNFLKLFRCWSQNNYSFRKRSLYVKKSISTWASTSKDTLKMKTLKKKVNTGEMLTIVFIQISHAQNRFFSTIACCRCCVDMTVGIQGPTHAQRLIVVSWGGWKEGMVLDEITND